MSAPISPSSLPNWLPMLRWMRHYRRDHATGDGVAAAVVTLMLVPQSLAYAQLAGMPPEAGLYASILPLVVYSVLGTSSALAVGPAAVTSLMTAAAAGALAPEGTPIYGWAVWWLAALSGAISLLLGVLRLGVLAHFLSHPVLHGFVSASGILIAASQLKHLLGVPLNGTTLPSLLAQGWHTVGGTHGPTLLIGAGTLAVLLAARRGLRPGLRRLGWSATAADIATKAAPVAILAAVTAVCAAADAASHGVRVVGTVPAGLPTFTWPGLGDAGWAGLEPLLLPAFLLAIVGFVESVSVGQSLAARRRERIDPDAELRALGAGNLAAAVSGGFPVTGGFARSVVNFEAGARTPAAGLYTAVGLAGVAAFLTPALHHLPQAALAATIMVAVLTLVDLPAFARIWRYSHSDFAAMALTAALTLTVGVEVGLGAGVLASFALLLYRNSRPHIAVVGRIPGTEHFRNVERHAVETVPHVLGLRVDESLTFANARFLEDYVAAQVATRPAVRDVVLQCSAINEIDASALESLQTIQERLAQAGIRLHLSEVKGPVMDRLQRAGLPARLSGQVFLSHHQAIETLAPRGATSG
ncbi:SulP family inorganic anion transporter [Tepidimonas sp.]|uniref:SulP family inorganic anion transporter n=1 Tax=Tepidimonas sp. TaxID=2002775 RepID=UPI002FDF0F63